ncbi:MAG: DUF2065 domain-containing protein [Enterobacter sp.]|nr:DUF2065 domain-containing protein [Enterobacter sp.]
MNSTIWLALALVLVLEGLGPMLYPRAWRRMIATMSQLPDNILRRFGGGLKRLADQKVVGFGIF